MRVDVITINKNGVVLVRFLKDDGDFHRGVYSPDMNIESIEYQEVKEKAQKLWTVEVVETYKQSLKDNIEVIDGSF